MFRTASRALAVAQSRLKRIPTRQDWLETLCAAGVFALAAGLIHTFMSPIQFSMSLPGARYDPEGFLRLAAIAILIPALGEELVFRGLLQPKSLTTPTRYLVSLMSLGLFVLWHPFQVWIGSPTGQTLFLEPGFLILVAILGTLCAGLTQRTNSLWPAVALHWGVVVSWKAGTG